MDWKGGAREKTRKNVQWGVNPFIINKLKIVLIHLIRINKPLCGWPDRGGIRPGCLCGKNGISWLSGTYFRWDTMNRIFKVIYNQIRGLCMARSESLHLCTRKNRKHCSQVQKRFAKKNKHPLMRLIRHPDRQAFLLRVDSNLFFLPDIYPPHEISWVRMMYWSACQFTWTETIYILFINKGRITGDLNIRTTGMAIWKKG